MTRTGNVAYAEGSENNMERQITQTLSLKDRILQLSYENHLSHIGSCLTAVDAIDTIHQMKGMEDRFVLSNGHAGLALYVVLEKYGLGDAQELLTKHGVHPNRDTEHGIMVSTGSLGHGLPIAVGFALARPDHTTYCMVSDGCMAEGSIWEALRIGVEKNLTNLKIVCNMNGYAAYRPTDEEGLIRAVAGFGWQVDVVDGHDIAELKQSLEVQSPEPQFIFARTNVNQYPFLDGIGAHYYTMNEHDYAVSQEEPISK